MTRYIWMLGDVHGNFDHILETVKASGETPAAVIFLGDLECPIPFSDCVADIEAAGIACWAIPGNHDTDSIENYENLWGDRLFQERNLHGRVVEIAGIRVAGLGGVFRGEIWHPPEDPKFLDYVEFASVQRMKQGEKRRLSQMDIMRLESVPSSTADIKDFALDGRLRKHRSTIFYADYLNLYGKTADILVTHEAPACHPHGFQEIGALAQSLHVKFAFHGHHHDSLNYRSHDDQHGFAAYGVGFMGITDLFGGLIRVGCFDEERAYRNEKTRAYE